MGRRKQSDISRAENFNKHKGDQDRPTKRLRIGVDPLEGEWKPGKENQPVQPQMEKHEKQIFISPEKTRIFNNMKLRFRLERDSDSQGFSGTHPDMLKSSFYKFQVHDPGNFFPQNLKAIADFSLYP